MTADDATIARQVLQDSRKQFQLLAGRVHHAVEQMNDQQIWWRERDEFNSAGNLLLHITGNVSERIVSLVGGQAYQRDRDAEFAERNEIPKTTLLARFDATRSEVDRILSTLPPERLLEIRRYQMLAGEVESTLLTLVLQTLVHVAGHVQEIIGLARRQLGAAYRFQLPKSRAK